MYRGVYLDITSYGWEVDAVTIVDFIVDVAQLLLNVPIFRAREVHGVLRCLRRHCLKLIFFMNFLSLELGREGRLLVCFELVSIA